jgi:transcriptional regulator with XRE-family HTH domain
VKKPTPGFDPVRDGLEDLGEFIRGQREVARMSVRRLAELAGVSNPYLSQIERGLRRPSADILQQIAKALRISTETLYVRAGILDAEVEGDVSVPEAIRRDAALTSNQKQALLAVYQGFRAQGSDTPTDQGS